MNHYIAMTLAASLFSPIKSSEPEKIKVGIMPSTINTKLKLEFSCRYESIPKSSKETEDIFNYARWLQKGVELKKDVKLNKKIERLYRIAGENGNHKANINLQLGALAGLFDLTSHEHLRFSQKLVDADIATGYYLIGSFLTNGEAGLKRDQDMGWKFMMKATKEGSADAQYYLAEELAPVGISPQIANRMFECAAQQGHGKSALSLGIISKIEKRYDEALINFQLGIAAGSVGSASRLKEAFSDIPETDSMYYLAQHPDVERSERYEKIWTLLTAWSYANPKVPEINEIIPLPPAILPPWDGKLQWVEERLANVPPPEPSEYELRELAKASFLEPDTGKPTPENPGFERKSIPSLLTKSGNPCPRTGYWSTTLHHEYHRHDPFEDEHVTRRFTEGTLLPTMVETQLHRRLWPWPDELIKQVVNVRWEYIG